MCIQMECVKKGFQILQYYIGGRSTSRSRGGGAITGRSVVGGPNMNRSRVGESSTSRLRGVKRGGKYSVSAFCGFDE